MAHSFNRHRLPYVFTWRQVMLRYGRVIFLCGLFTLAAGGCQRGSEWNLASVEGTVTKGGRPLQGILVVFLPDADAGTTGPRSIDRTDKSGHYRLRTDKGEDGVVIGKHRVITLDPQAPKGGAMGATARSPQLLERAKHLMDQQKTAGDALQVPSIYEQFNKTPLRAKVHSGPQTLNFDIPYGPAHR
jgi:hypothetical protein